MSNNREFSKALSLSGADMNDEQYWLIYDRMMDEVDLNSDEPIDFSPEEVKERAAEEYNAQQVQPHPDDVWNPKYRAIGKRLWPVFMRSYGTRH